MNQWEIEMQEIQEFSDSYDTDYVEPEPFSAVKELQMIATDTTTPIELRVKCLISLLKLENEND